MADMTSADADAANDAEMLRQPACGDQIRPGMAVYDTRGRRLGRVERAEPSKGYVAVKTRGIFSRNLYIPLGAAARLDERGVHLRLAKGDLDGRRWYLPPTNGVDVTTSSLPSPHSELQSLAVPVTHDALHMEHVPVTDQAIARALGPDVFTEKDIDVPLMGERVELERRTRVTEEVLLRQRQVTEQQTYTGEVRKGLVWGEGSRRERKVTPGDTSNLDDLDGTSERDISDEDTIAYDWLARDQDELER